MREKRYLGKIDEPSAWKMLTPADEEGWEACDGYRDFGLISGRIRRKFIAFTGGPDEVPDNFEVARYCGLFLTPYRVLATSSTVTGSRKGMLARSFLPMISMGWAASASRKA